MSLIKGKVVKFSFNNADVPFKTAKLKKSHTKSAVTDNSSTNIEYKPGRYTAEIELTCVIYKNGVKQIGKELAFTFNAVAYKTTSLSFEDTYEETPTTHGNTPADATDWDISLSERKITAEIWQEDTTADPATGVEQAATLSFAPGVSAAGNVVLESKDVDGEIKSDQKLTLAGFINGAVVETSLGLANGTQAVAKLLLADGLVTDKEVTGTATLTSKKISTSLDSDVEVTYKFKFTGAITENVKADA
ncbi:MAG: hypothetical protein HYS25_13820 [Ignavibacteriales bacterium]|nr:hypothetical protein [Ignavibacteriales bacterium]